MKIHWKDIRFSFFNFFLNPIEKYEIHIRIIIVILYLTYFFHKKIGIFFFGGLIMSLIPIILEYYREYKKNYKLIKSIQENSSINDVSIFPSGKIIVMTSYYIKIYDINFNVIQTIVDSNNNIFISIKDENNFLVYTNINILLYESNNNLNYSLRRKIKNLSNLISAYFFAKKYLLCISNDKIKIFEKKIHGDYEMINNIKEAGIIRASLFLEKEKILISSGENGTYLRKFKKLDLIKKFELIKCDKDNGIENIGNNRIVILSNCYIYVISITQKEIIKLFNFYLGCNVIHAVKRKNIILIGKNNNIYIYSKDKLKYLETSITDKYKGRKYKKIIGINNEKYLYLPFNESRIYISKY